MAGQYDRVYELGGEERRACFTWRKMAIGEQRPIAIDLETKEIHWVNSQRHVKAFPFEVNL